VSDRVRRTADGISFHCPGCGDTHTIPTEGEKAWSWNGSLDLPTVTPSIDVKCGHYASSWKPGDECWCGKDYDFTCYRCHSTIMRGEITFAPDSSHKLSGQTVMLPDVI
jgi:Family of unknown function (DUF6527)